MFRINAFAAVISLAALPALAQTQETTTGTTETTTLQQPTFSATVGVQPATDGTAPADGTGTASGTTAGNATGAAAADPAEPDEKEIDWSTLDAANYAGGPLPEDQSTITAKVQTLLDRAGVSPGVIDGWWGGMTRTAIADFERREGLPVDGEMDARIWELLDRHAVRPITQSYTISEEDTDVVGPIPADYSEKAEYQRLGYQRVTEKLAEKFHMDEGFLRTLNAGADFAAGETITVMAPGDRLQATVTNVHVDKRRQRLYALDGAGGLISSYPVTIGSAETPSPSGTVEVTSITEDPWYNYDPDTFVQGDNYQKLSLPPGPNNPVGLVWIALDRPGYGIHGTPSPDSLFTGASHGCVRMTNWDALELAAMVDQGTVVEFIE